MTEERDKWNYRNYEGPKFTSRKYDNVYDTLHMMVETGEVIRHLWERNPAHRSYVFCNRHIAMNAKGYTDGGDRR
jgi:hypothetical protein